MLSGAITLSILALSIFVGVFLSGGKISKYSEVRKIEVSNLEEVEAHAKRVKLSKIATRKQKYRRRNKKRLPAGAHKIDHYSKNVKYPSLYLIK